MKILVTGGKGMLGRTLCKNWLEHEMICADLPEADITDREKFTELVAAVRPDTVIHCAAMTAVDRCETEKDLAYLLNAQGSANVAYACAKNDVRLIAISTDYVFNGELDRPYNEFDLPDGGRTVYGQSKFVGEEEIRRILPEKHLICRISWLYGPGGPSFVHTMLNLADGIRPELKVVADQIGNPTGTLAVADKLREIVLHPEISGTLHLTCEGEATWAEFAEEIFRLAGRKQMVVHCTTDEFPRPAPRPKNSRLEKLRLKQLGLAPMPHWKSSLAEFMKQEFGL